MTTSLKTLDSILVIGPTGFIGKALCTSLISRKSEFKRIAFFNDISRPETQEKRRLFALFRDGGMEEISGRYTDIAAFRGFDCVMMPLGNHAVKFQPTIIDSAITAGVRHFYTSEWGADLSVGSNWAQRYYRDKVLTREHLEKRGKAADTPDLGWTYILVGRLTEYSITKHFGFDNAQRRADIYGTPTGRQSLISTPDAVAFTMETLKHPFSMTGEAGNIEAHRRFYRFHGSSPTWTDIFNTLETVTGHRYAVSYHNVESALEKEARAKKLGDVELELEASHQLIQGREGTLLPEPFDNNRFPTIHPEPVQPALQRIFADPEMKEFLGLQ